TNVRNSKSPYWRGWLKAEWRCLVPATSFCEWTDSRPKVTQWQNPDSDSVNPGSNPGPPAKSHFSPVWPSCPPQGGRRRLLFPQNSVIQTTNNLSDERAE